MKTKLLLTILLAIFCLSISAQTMFQKRYGGSVGDEEGFCVRQTSDGGYIIGGTTSSFGAGNSDAYLIKTNLTGDTLWTKVFGGAGMDYGYSLQQTTDGGYIVSGTTVSFGSLDFYLIKTNSTGDTLWTKTIGIVNEFGYSIQQTSDGGYILLGKTNGFGIGDFDAHLVNTDASGNILWTKGYGGTGTDEGISVQQTSDAGYIIMGTTNSFGAGLFDIFLIKTNSTGDTLWTKTYGGLNNDGLENYEKTSHCVQQTSDGGYIVTGHTASFGSGNEDAYLIKTDNAGNLLWSKTYGGTGSEVGFSTRQTTDGGYVIAGFTSSFGAGSWDAYLIKTNSIGDTLWTKTFGTINDELAYSIQQTSDGGYIMSGFIDTITGGISDIYLIKTDSAGNSGCNQSMTNTIITTPVTVLTNPTMQIFSGGTATPTNSIVNNGGIVNTICLITSVNESNYFINGMNIYPNPFSMQAVLQTANLLHNATLMVDNCFGQTVAQIKN